MRAEMTRAALWAARSARRRWSDAAARYVVALGGLVTVLSILTMLAFLSAETWPLLRGARVVGIDRVRLPDVRDIAAVGVDEYRQFVMLVRADGTIALLRPGDGQVVQTLELVGGRGHTVRASRRVDPEQVFVWLDDGRLLAARLRVEPVYEPAGRRFAATVTPLGQWPLVSPGAVPARFAASRVRDGALTVAWIAGNDRVALWARRVQTSLFGDEEAAEARIELPVTEPTVVALDRRGSRLLVGRRGGTVQLWDIAEPGEPRLVDESLPDSWPAPITALEYLLGEQSFVVADERGRVSVWQAIRGETGGSQLQLVRMHEFSAHTAAVVAIVASQRDKGFVTADAQGGLKLRHSTSEQTLLEFNLEEPTAAPLVALAPKGDGVVALSTEGTLVSWAVDNPHPEITLRTLFGKVWYEGYPQPAFVWQSTGGTDDFEPKFSLVPLLFGTVKGTAYALLFAVPLAVLAALYTALFSPPAVRNVVKPTVEVMAALPSVVLGFVAGLVLAPALERHMPGFLAALVLAPLSVAVLGVVWFFWPWKGLLPRGGEVVVATTVLCLVVWAFWSASGWLERALFGGDFRHWLSASFDLRFDQRNCVVIGLAMGFAVIPLIFSITEEALSNVPQRLVSASLALGATPWQTAIKVVLPAASPGIFSAVMIGFGRAVGETMIVLMATGNTPVMEWNIFTGMRTLSANIAVEIPEAPYASTLYRVLFLAALLLFAVTFVANTAAEIVRQRLRQRYQQM